MAFLIGWADVMLFNKYNFFATMMTGNTMKAGSAIFAQNFPLLAFWFSAIVAYCIGVSGFRRAELSLKGRSLRGFLAPIVTMLFVGSDYLSWRNPAFKFLPCMMLSCAYGIVNSVGSEVTGTMTFVVTGALTRITNIVTDRLSRTAGRKKLTPALIDACKMSGGVFAGFFTGALFGAAMLAKAPQLLKGGAFGTIGLIYGALFLWVDREALGAWWDGDGELCSIDERDGTCK